jgi:membrane protein YqaA with SNARE-associated domain
MLRRLYDWCIAAADRRSASWALGAVSFAESSFFPIPPDVMLIPMALARPDKAYFYAALCTVTSVVGGLLGYLIGALLYDSIGAWVILLKGLTPIPYKLVTITSGFAGYNIFLFVLFSAITRAARFFIVAFLLHRYGAQAREIIEKRLGFWTAMVAIGIIAGFVILTRVI